MKRWALIKNIEVDMIVEQVDQPSVFTNIGHWVDITDLSVGPGYKYIDKKFIPPDPQPVILTRLEYITKLGDSYSSIVAAAKTDVAVEVWLEKFRLTENFNLSDATVISDVLFLVTKNLITQDKANTILRA